MRWPPRASIRATSVSPRGDPPLVEATPLPSAAELADRFRERLVALPLPEDGPERRLAIASAIEGWLAAEGVAPADAGGGVLQDLVDELAGLGPLEPLLADERIAEIIVDGVRPIGVEVDGVLHVTSLRFRDSGALRSVVERMLVGSGRRVDDGAPMVDARLRDGSRVNAVLPPVAVDGPLVTIRRPPRRGLGYPSLVAGGMLDERPAAFLHAAVLGRCNILISGGAGAGKTTLLAALAGLVPETQRLVVLEDVAELVVDHPRAVSLQCRPCGRDGLGEITLRDLVRNSLRMRPDRIAVGEVRGAEAGDMLQAMNTGHDGSMATLHANSAADALTRVEAMLGMAWPELSDRQLQRWIGAAIDIVVHVERAPDGRRVVAEVAGLDRSEDTPLLVPLFRLLGAGGTSAGCGEVPRRCLERMAGNGVRFPASLFASGPMG